MNKRQRQRMRTRRRQHQEETRDRDLPRLIMSRESYPKVERAHIVPRMYQKAFAVSGMVAVHRAGREDCSLMSTKRAGTRPAFYRRTRPSGDTTDDVEASLAYIESKAAPVLHAVVRGAPPDLAAKGALAQLFAVQLLRGPAFFEQRKELLTPMIEQLTEEDVVPAALAAAGGDMSALRGQVLDAYLNSTNSLMTMLQKTGKIAGILGNMRWHVLNFGEPSLAYSDHPVVVVPSGKPMSEPADRQDLGPLSAVEIRVPISPSRAILMNWIARADPEGEIWLGRDAAAELNAFTIAQAEEEWMHMPNHEPPIAQGPFEPVSRFIQAGYDEGAMSTSVRHEFAIEWIEKNQGRNWINDLQLADIRF